MRYFAHAEDGEVTASGPLICGPKKGAAKGDKSNHWVSLRGRPRGRKVDSRPSRFPLFLSEPALTPYPDV